MFLRAKKHSGKITNSTHFRGLTGECLMPVYRRDDAACLAGNETMIPDIMQNQYIYSTSVRWAGLMK